MRRHATAVAIHAMLLFAMLSTASPRAARADQHAMQRFQVGEAGGEPTIVRGFSFKRELELSNNKLVRFIQRRLPTIKLTASLGVRPGRLLPVPFVDWSVAVYRHQDRGGAGGKADGTLALRWSRWHLDTSREPGERRHIESTRRYRPVDQRAALADLEKLLDLDHGRPVLGERSALRALVRSRADHRRTEQRVGPAAYRYTERYGMADGTAEVHRRTGLFGLDARSYEARDEVVAGHEGRYVDDLVELR